MIDQLLLRIAQRGTELSPARHDSSLVSSDGASQPYFPARPVQRTSTQPDRALAMWQQSKQDYLQTCVQQALVKPTVSAMPAMPEVFAQFGAAHCAVAALLWAQQDNLAALILSSPTIAIRGSEGLVALYEAIHQTVHISTLVSPAGLHFLNLSGQPTSGPALAPKQQFHTTTMNMLLWFYAQTVPSAVLLMPDAVISQRLQLRKFPAVAAPALEVRHLNLIHRFSAGAVSFDQLVRQASDDEVASLCADLTALYITGALSAA